MRFVTVFPEAWSVHLRKGVGKIPYFFHQMYDYDSILLCRNKSITAEDLSTYTPGLKIHYLAADVPQGLQVCQYILKHAKTIDVLNLYSLSKSTFIYGFLYKMLNPKGAVYLKMDMNYEYLLSLTQSGVSKFHLRLWAWFFNNKCSVISYEAKAVGALLQKFYAIQSDKLHYMPIGIDVEAMQALPFSRKDFQQKENIILAAGRIGLYDKNNEMLLAASLKLNLRDWKIVFAGPVQVSFQPVIELYFARHPDMKEKVLFTGNLEKLEDLCSWYNKAKVFCLTSRQESGPTALTEAMYWGNYVVSGRLCSVKEMLEDEKLGSLIDSEETLITGLQYCIDHTDLLEEKAKLAFTKVEQKFSWQKLVELLKNKLDSN